MPSFSLVRRFRKQQKATLNSSVSSALVGQHVGHPILESSNIQTMQDLPAVDTPSRRTVNDLHGLLSGTIALSQNVEDVSIRNINGPVMSNNHVHITTNYYGSKANLEDSGFAVLRVGDIYLEEEVGRYSDVNDVRGTKYKGRIMPSSTLNMSIWSYCGGRAAEVNNFSDLYCWLTSLGAGRGIQKICILASTSKHLAVIWCLPLPTSHSSNIPWCTIFHGSERLLWVIAIIKMDGTLSQTCASNISYTPLSLTGVASTT
ncbi:hypothetical protein C8J56DRAFT_942065 [Mycena floridula]|nr:hypothetical protein C8J56DRAFT_942065 [Mycena floridula]